MKAQLRAILARLADLFRRRRMEESMTEEMQAHLDMLTDANIAAGLSPEEALRCAASAARHRSKNNAASSAATFGWSRV
jgi:Flp pilus assembly protein TadB